MKILPDLFLTFAKIGAFTFGGGYAMLPLIDHECVEKKHWITADELTDITVIAESTPGPIAVNCATYTGYKQKGVAGAVWATLGMVFPSFVIILLLSVFFERFSDNTLIIRAFAGMRIAVGILIVQAALKMIRKMMNKTQNNAVGIAFVAVFFTAAFILNLLRIHFSTIYFIMISGLFGYLLDTVPKRNGGGK